MTGATEQRLLRLAQHAPAPQGIPTLVPLAELGAAVDSGAARLGVRLAAADAIETLVPHLARLAVIAIEFGGPGEGRGYSAARLLRQRYGFGGELRAVGAVKQDQLYLLARAGFDAFELAPGEDPQAAAAALRRFDVAYQPGDAAVALRQQRFFTRHA